MFVIRYFGKYKVSVVEYYIRQFSLGTFNVYNINRRLLFLN